MPGKKPKLEAGFATDKREGMLYHWEQCCGKAFVRNLMKEKPKMTHKENS